MAEGAPPGAPSISGTEEDPSHFFHQPPPVDGVNFGSQPLAPPPPLDTHADTAGPESRTGSPDSSRLPISPPIAPTRPATPVDVGPFPLSPALDLGSPGSPGSPGGRPQARARFPSDAGKLFRTYSAPNNPPESKRADSLAYDGEKDQNPTTQSRRGGWQSIRSWVTQWTEGLGWPEKAQDIQDVMGDVGIDMDVMRKAKKKGSHKKVSSLVGSSMALVRPGLGSRTESSSTVPTTRDASASGSGMASGMATPGTLRRIFGAGVDPLELQSALRKLKGKLSQRDSKQAKYVQAKAELAHRRNLVLLVVYAFMAYGAPSHRLEQYALQLFKALEMDGRVNYTVGCMEISFINPVDPDDPMTRSAYTTLVKAQGLDVGACDLAFRIYKDVVAGEIEIEEAITKLTELIEAPSYYGPLVMIPLYGCSSALTCVWAFGGYWADMVISFLLGSLVGVLQLLAVKNPLYSNVLEVTAALFTSFGARAFASIGGPGQRYFCFGAIAQSSIATILPGYTVLTGTLELQSKSITAGSTRLFYAVIYSLLLGYGMSVGSQIWAAVYPAAPTSATCPRAIDDLWNILLVPAFIVCQSVIIRSRPRQIPVQVLIGSTAYAVNYFVSKKTTAQVADTASALVLGILGHLWARSHRAFAFAAVVAGIMCLVPGGLAAQGGLTAGITSSLYTNGSAAETQSVYEANIYRSFGVGAQMIEVAVGLAVGIFLSALIVYPFGKKNNALFSF